MSSPTTQLDTAKFSYHARRESDAFHEAGHATVAALLGVPIDAVELLPEGSEPSANFRFGMVTPEQRDAVVVVAKAGLLAELALNPSVPRTPRRQDERIARRAMRGRLDLLFAPARMAYLQAAELEALKLVSEHRETIKALAQLLLESEQLSGQEVESFVRERMSPVTETA